MKTPHWNIGDMLSMPKYYNNYIGTNKENWKAVIYYPVHNILSLWSLYGPYIHMSDLKIEVCNYSDINYYMDDIRITQIQVYDIYNNYSVIRHDFWDTAEIITPIPFNTEMRFILNLNEHSFITFQNDLKSYGVRIEKHV